MRRHTQLAGGLITVLVAASWVQAATFTYDPNQSPNTFPAAHGWTTMPARTSAIPTRSRTTC